MKNIAYRAPGRNQFETFSRRSDVQHRRLPLAAKRLKMRYGFTDSLALTVAELAGYQTAVEV